MTSAPCETVSSDRRELDHEMAEELRGHPKKRAFLAAYRETGNVRLACTAAQIGRSSHYRWLAEDHDYEVAFEQAKKDAVDVLEAEARRRAVEGWEEPGGETGGGLTRPPSVRRLGSAGAAAFVGGGSSEAGQVCD